jgi:hypothetical protein
VFDDGDGFRASNASRYGMICNNASEGTQYYESICMEMTDVYGGGCSSGGTGYNDPPSCPTECNENNSYDSIANIYPGAPEICDGQDNDCV